MLLTQQELAQVAGVSVATIRAAEAGYGQQPRLRTMRLLAKALGVDVRQVDEFRIALNLPDTPPAPAP